MPRFQLAHLGSVWDGQLETCTRIRPKLTFISFAISTCLVALKLQ